MKIRTLGWLVGLSAIASSFLSCTQAKYTCVVGHAGAGPYIAQFFPAGAAPTCAAKTMSPALGVSIDAIPGDSIGMETYHPVMTSADGMAPDFTKGTVALQVDSLGALVGSRNPDPDPTHKLFAIGDWAGEYPDTTDFCPVQNVKAAEQDLPDVPAVPPAMCKADADCAPMKCDMAKGTCMGDMGMPDQPAVSIKYEWTNLKIYVTAAAAGTQFSADLNYTQDSCTVPYHVRGMWPAVGCLVVDPADPKMKNMIPDDTQCCPAANPAQGRATGSGINPDFPTKCDPVLGMCVLDAPADAKLPIIGAKPNPICGPVTSVM